MEEVAVVVGAERRNTCSVTRGCGHLDKRQATSRGESKANVISTGSQGPENGETEQDSALLFFSLDSSSVQDSPRSSSVGLGAGTDLFIVQFSLV